MTQSPAGNNQTPTAPEWFMNIMRHVPSQSGSENQSQLTSNSSGSLPVTPSSAAPIILSNSPIIINEQGLANRSSVAENAPQPPSGMVSSEFSAQTGSPVLDVEGRPVTHGGEPLSYQHIPIPGTGMRRLDAVTPDGDTVFFILISPLTQPAIVFQQPIDHRVTTITSSQLVIENQGSDQIQIAIPITYMAANGQRTEVTQPIIVNDSVVAPMSVREYSTETGQPISIQLDMPVDTQSLVLLPVTPAGRFTQSEGLPYEPTFTPNPGFTGTFPVIMIQRDGDGDLAFSTLSISINPPASDAELIA